MDQYRAKRMRTGNTIESCENNIDENRVESNNFSTNRIV